MLQLLDLPPSLSSIFSPSPPPVSPLCRRLITKAVPRSKLAALLRLPHSAPHRCANTGHSVKAGHPRSNRHMPHRREMAALPGTNDGQLTYMNESDQLLVRWPGTIYTWHTDVKCFQHPCHQTHHQTINNPSSQNPTAGRWTCSNSLKTIQRSRTKHTHTHTSCVIDWIMAWRKDSHCLTSPDNLGLRSPWKPIFF